MITQHFLTRHLGAAAHSTKLTGTLYESLRIMLGRDSGSMFKHFDNGSIPKALLIEGEESTRRRRILLFTYLPFWMKVCVPTAAVLGQLGHKVDLVFLPFERFDRTEPWYERFYHRLVYQQLQKLQLPGVRMHLLNGSSHGLTRAEEPEAREQAITDVCYVVQSDSYDLHDPYHRRVFDFRLRRNRTTMAALEKLMQNNRYDLMLVPNGSVLEFGAAYRAAKLRQLPCVSFEHFNERGDVLISHGPPIFDLSFGDNWWQSDLDAADDVLHHVVDQIRYRSLPRGGQNDERYQSVAPQTPEAIYAKLGLSEHRHTALLCPNLIGDSATLNRAMSFRNLREWITETVKWFAARDDWQLIIRVHPAEQRYGTREPVASVVRAALPEPGANVFVIEADDPINTYSVMPVADLGIVYTSTTGLEMAVLGVPTLCAGRAHYRGKGFTMDPESAEEYFAMIARYDPAAAKRWASQQRKTAALYFDYLFTKWPHKFPWHGPSIGTNRDIWPVDSVLSEEGQAEFGQVWSLLANLRDA